MVDEDKRFVQKFTLLVSVCVTILFAIFIVLYAKGYTNKAIKAERQVTRAYVDSVFDGEFVPKLNTIINQQDTIIDIMRTQMINANK